jgi:hypothetical protein
MFSFKAFSLAAWSALAASSLVFNSFNLACWVLRFEAAVSALAFAVLAASWFLVVGFEVARASAFF